MGNSEPTLWVDSRIVHAGSSSERVAKDSFLPIFTLLSLAILNQNERLSERLFRMSKGNRLQRTHDGFRAACIFQVRSRNIH
jgi:hypothetical protein